MEPTPPRPSRARRGSSRPLARTEYGNEQWKSEVQLTTQDWPDWWAWELELSAHLLKRMEDRAFNEVDLRRMLEYATGYRPDILEGRFVIDAKHRDAAWEVIVEPDDVRRLLVVITAYPVERTES